MLLNTLCEREAPVTKMHSARLSEVPGWSRSATGARLYYLSCHCVNGFRFGILKMALNTMDAQRALAPVEDKRCGGGSSQMSSASFSPGVFRAESVPRVLDVSLV